MPQGKQLLAFISHSDLCLSAAIYVSSSAWNDFFFSVILRAIKYYILKYLRTIVSNSNWFHCNKYGPTKYFINTSFSLVDIYALFPLYKKSPHAPKGDRMKQNWQKLFLQHGKIVLLKQASLGLILTPLAGKQGAIRNLPCLYPPCDPLFLPEEVCVFMFTVTFLFSIGKHLEIYQKLLKGHFFPSPNQGNANLLIKWELVWKYKYIFVFQQQQQQQQNLYSEWSKIIKKKNGTNHLVTK